MIRATYDWMMRMAGHRRAPSALAVVSFVESSFFPIPPDIMLVPMVLANRAKAWFYAALCTVASVLGGIAGYAIGFYAFDHLAKPLLELYGYAEKFQQFSAHYNEWGAWIVFFAGVTPFPYKVITIASGVTRIDLVVFIVASILARGLRFFVVAALLYWFGEPIRTFIERRLGLLFTIFTVLLFAGFLAVRFLF
jgi:membrane protein YqaA with SNARE-associated domain